MSRFDDKPVGGDEEGRPYLVHASSKLDQGRARGALLGLAVGDALGATHQYGESAEVAFKPALAGPQLDLVGGGPYGVARGQVGEPTQLATVVARSMMEEGGFKADAVGHAYARWGAVAFAVAPETAAVLTRVAAGASPPDAARAVWLETERSAAGNGALARVVPIALMYEPLPVRLRDNAMADAALTHFDPRCQLASVALGGAIAAAVKGGERPDAHALLARARADVAAAAATLAAQVPEEALAIEASAAMITEDLAAAERDDPGLYAADAHLVAMPAYVRVALRMAFWQLLHARSLPAALVDVVNRGGDTAVNAAVTGALLGALYGASAIPSAWGRGVLDALVGQAGPWADTYHPRRLLELLP